MKINELLMSIHNKDFNIEKRLEVKKYLPMEVKKVIAQSVIYECTEEQNGVIQVDSVQRYMSYVRHMITTHTNLEYTDENYDVLCSTEYMGTTLLNAIVATFNSDADECNRILDMMMDDYLDNNNVSNYIVMAINDLIKNVNHIMSSIESKVDGINIAELIPEGVDLGAISKLLNINSKE